MSDPSLTVRVTLRIPGNWEHPGQLLERLPAGYRLTPESLTLPDGQEIEFDPMPPDDQFAGIFASSCRRPASEDEMKRVRSYKVNICLSGPGGSLENAATMMRAGAAIIEAGAAGVFIDNSGLAHGGGDWQEMADVADADALSFAFVSIIQGEEEVWTMGMHVLGQPEIVMKRADADADGDNLIEVIRYVCEGSKPIGHGHLLADEYGPRFQAVATQGGRFKEGMPMYNPFGRLKLVSVKEIAEGN